MTSRRHFLTLLPLTGCSMALPSVAARITSSGLTPAGLSLEPAPTGAMRPLDRLKIRGSQAGTLVVRDGDHQIYLHQRFDRELEIVLGGALGTHSVSLLQETEPLAGRVLASTTFQLDCTTAIDDGGNVFGVLLRNLYWTMATDGPVGAGRYKGQVFTYWASWLMDNTNTGKGMRYFWPEVTSNVDFYVAAQREDGMVWENFEPRTPVETDWERRFNYGDFSRPAENGYMLLRRAPVENHVEAFLIEAIYSAWQATGNTAWMSAKLDAAVKAVKYATSDSYRWSEKYRLLKRGFTIDTWDFLSDTEASRVDGDIMKIDLKKTRFGVFFGDNTRLIDGLSRLAEMLEAAGRAAEAPEFRHMAAEMRDRLNALSWNGEFFTHWIPEDRDLKLDMGVDTARQVSLSNAYSLSQGIPYEQSIAILKTYQRLRREMPAASPGEFYAIYPPYEKGFGDEGAKWEYMNGGVMSCVAGELARGAFENGFEEYGADILRRYQAIAASHNDFVPGILRGNRTEAPRRTLTPVNLRDVVNADFGAGAAGVPGWTGEPGNDLASLPHGLQVFREVPFDIIDPATNGLRACLAVSSTGSYRNTVTLPLRQKARSMYLLHAKGGDDLVGKLTWVYADGSRHCEYIRAGVNIKGWWAPVDTEFDYRYGPIEPERMQVAWRGRNQKFGNVGLCITAFTHPHADKEIESLVFDAMETGAKWMIAGLTLSDAGPYLPYWNDVSGGMPNNWGAGALAAAAIEGLAGVRDQGVAFGVARIAPRWQAAGEVRASVSVRYPASRGYVTYQYDYGRNAKTIALQFTGSPDAYDVEVLLPAQTRFKTATLNGTVVPAATRTIGSSSYAVLQVKGRAVHSLQIQLV